MTGSLGMYSDKYDK